MASLREIYGEGLAQVLYPMACETEVWQAKLTLGAGSFCRCIMLDDALLVRVVTGGAGDAPARHDRQDDIEPFFGFIHIVEGPCRRFYEKMHTKKLARHGRVTTPAKKSNVGPEPHVLRKINCRVRYLRMTQKTY